MQKSRRCPKEIGRRASPARRRTTGVEGGSRTSIAPNNTAGASCVSLKASVLRWFGCRPGSRQQNFGEAASKSVDDSPDGGSCARWARSADCPHITDDRLDIPERNPLRTRPTEANAVPKSTTLPSVPKKDTPSDKPSKPADVQGGDSQRMPQATQYSLLLRRDLTPVALLTKARCIPRRRLVKYMSTYIYIYAQGDPFKSPSPNKVESGLDVT